MKIIITREPGFKEQHYCILEFKGKFQTEDLPTKSLVHIGSLQRISESQYKLEIGVMDLVGKAANLQEGWLYTETVLGTSPDEKIIVVKGVITKKIIFDKRPCPNMERSEIEPRLTLANNLFKNLEIKGQKAQ